jgi:hypothetical protein
MINHFHSKKQDLNKYMFQGLEYNGLFNLQRYRDNLYSKNKELNRYIFVG